jgi:hypothetical protein
MDGLTLIRRARDAGLRVESQPKALRYPGLEKAQKIRMRSGGSANVLEDFPDKRNSCAGGPMIVCVALTISLKNSRPSG